MKVLKNPRRAALGDWGHHQALMAPTSLAWDPTTPAQKPPGQHQLRMGTCSSKLVSPHQAAQLFQLLGRNKYNAREDSYNVVVYLVLSAYFMTTKFIYKRFKMAERYIFNNQYFKFSLPEWACLTCRLFFQCNYCCNK